MKAFCEFRDSTDYPPVHGLQINSCGQQQAGQYGYTVLRSKGRSDYHLLYVQSGWITAEKDGAPVCISSVWGDRIFEKCGIRRDEGGDGGKTLEIRGKRRLSARDGGANYQQS